MYKNSDGNSYSSWSNNSGNSYTYTYTNITNNFDHSFNHTNSHNGHGRGGMCGIITLLAIVAPVLAGAWVLVSIITEVLR